MEAIKKLHEARKLIQVSSLKKEGHNSYSNYDYFTPSQISKLVHDANNKVGILDKFDLIISESGIKGFLTIYDLDSDDKIIFEMATAIPEIKATNETQKLGGAMTYTERYLKMTAYGIVDNNLDFDNHDNSKESKSKPEQEQEQEKEKQWITPNQVESYCKRIQENEFGFGEEAYVKFIKKLRNNMKVSKSNDEKLKLEFLSDLNKSLNN